MLVTANETSSFCSFLDGLRLIERHATFAQGDEGDASAANKQDHFQVGDE